jgi:MYXO-CTERM domain-containing protein
MIFCDDATGVPGGVAQVGVSFTAEGEAEVAGMQNDLSFDPEVFTVDGMIDCAINPAIGPDSEADKTLSSSNPMSDPARVRGLVVALDNVNVIPEGLLYTCNFAVAADAALGAYEVTTSATRASDPAGIVIPSGGSPCEIQIVEPTPTATPPECEDDEDCPEGEVCVDNECVTPTPTRTPIGFCEDDEDCPEGQVCVDNRCVTVTPTPIGFCEDDEDCPPGQVCADNRCVTPTPSPTPIGFCEDDDDCPEGQVCVNNQCVAVTPTVRRGGGGDGCSCEIDPREHAPGMAGAAAALLPALALWALRRRVKPRIRTAGS